MEHPQKKQIDRDIKKLPIRVMDIKELIVHDPGNVDRQKVDRLTKSIGKNGQIVPVLVTGNILRDGKHRYNSLKRLGKEEIIYRDITQLRERYKF